jgi:hypothetical protein
MIAEQCSRNRSSRAFKRNRRIYLVLLGGIVSSMLVSAFVKNSSVIQSGLFSVFYICFIPLSFKLIASDESEESGAKSKAIKATNVLFCVCIAVCAVFFLLSVPSMYGFEISATAAKILFGWMSIFTNNYFRV